VHSVTQASLELTKCKQEIKQWQQAEIQGKTGSFNPSFFDTIFWIVQNIYAVSPGPLHVEPTN
jgi:hypothetical protein